MCPECHDKGYVELLRSRVECKTCAAAGRPTAWASGDGLTAGITVSGPLKYLDPTPPVVDPVGGGGAGASWQSDHRATGDGVGGSGYVVPDPDPPVVVQTQQIGPSRWRHTYATDATLMSSMKNMVEEAVAAQTKTLNAKLVELEAAVPGLKTDIEYCKDDGTYRVLERKTRCMLVVVPPAKIVIT